MKKKEKQNVEEQNAEKQAVEGQAVKGQTVEGQVVEGQTAKGQIVEKRNELRTVSEEAIVETAEAMPKATRETSEASEEASEMAEAMPKATEEISDAAKMRSEVAVETSEAVMKTSEVAEKMPKTAEEMSDAAEEMLEAAEETLEAAEAMPEASKEASEAVKKTTIAAAADHQPEKQRDLQLKSVMETCDAFCKRNNMGETERANLFTILQTIADELSGSSLSDETLQKIAHALSYERDVAQAEIRGRNMRIEQLLAQQQATSQIHQLAMTAPSPSRPTPPYSRIGGLSAADRQTIWERGKEKRIRH